MLEKHIARHVTRKATTAALLAAALAAGTTGCAPTIVEMREREPVRRWTTQATSPAAVLDCLQAALDREGGVLGGFYNPKANLRTRREPLDGGGIAFVARGPRNNEMEFIVTTRPVGAGATVELRTWADWPRVIGPVIDGCAGAAR